MHGQKQRIYLKVRNIYRTVSEALRTSKGRNILTFLVFLAISAVFWLLLALNDDVQQDYNIPVQLEGFPEDVTLLSGYNTTLSVAVKDKGSSLMKYEFGNNPTMKLNFDDFINTGDTVLTIRASQLNSAVRSIFGNSASVVAMRPDSLKMTYTSNPGIKVPVIVDCDITTQTQYAYSGHPIVDVDSVMLYSNSARRYSIHAIHTRPLILANLTDTNTVDVALKVPAGIRAIPSSIKVVVPVEPLVAKQQKVAVEIINVPAGERVVTFPAITEVSYLIPKSMYHADMAPIKATVDYRDIRPGVKSLNISLSKLPSYVRNPVLTPDHVEYVIERIE